MMAIGDLTTRRAVWVATGLVALAAGCDMGGGSGFGGIGYTGHKRRIMCPAGDVKVAEAMALGKRVLAKHGFRIKTVDADGLSIETHPSEKIERGQEGRIRDSVVRLPNRVRRTASLEFSTRGDELEAWCQVKKERLTTADHRVFARQRQFDDTPTETPIDGEGATTAKQNTVWTSAGRDAGMESEILSDLRERIQRYRQRKQEQQAEPKKPQPEQK